MNTRSRYPLAAALATAALAALAAWAMVAGAGARADAPPPRSAPVASVAVAAAAGPVAAGYDGVVEAVRQTIVSAQVPGAVVALHVRAGDRVEAGQVLLRLDARAAEQAAAAGAAQARAARAAQEAATRDFDRQKRLFEQNYISPAALDRAEAQYKSAQAEAAAQLSSAGAARTQTDLHVVRAPYAGVVADVAVVLGDMAMPGRPLLTLYDPSALRIKAAVPQGVADRVARGAEVEAEVPGTQRRLRPVRVLWLPAADPATHTLELRLDLPPQPGLVPGSFARVWLPVEGGVSRLYVPAAAVLRRAESSAVYVVGQDGTPLLRHVRLGRADGERVEILSGVSAGERIALEPQAAARVN